MRGLRVLGRLALLALAVAALVAMASGPGQVLGAVLSWVLLGYLVVRAWPAVRADVGRLRSRFPGRGAYSVRGLSREDRTL